VPCIQKWKAAPRQLPVLNEAESELQPEAGQEPAVGDWGPGGRGAGWAGQQGPKGWPSRRVSWAVGTRGTWGAGWAEQRGPKGWPSVVGWAAGT